MRFIFQPPIVDPYELVLLLEPGTDTRASIASIVMDVPITWSRLGADELGRLPRFTSALESLELRRANGTRVTLTSGSDQDFIVRSSSQPGPAGTKGDTGDPGPIGPGGPPGDEGPPGPAGDRGPAGPEGAASTVPGPAGAKGDVGEVGPGGAAGPPGDLGVPGPAGDVGPAGEQGPAGPAGSQGPPGAAGAASTVPGPAGPQGAKGDVGSTGPQGVKGDTGNAGPAGAASTVPGPAGSQGPAGPQGDQGPPGAASTVAGPQGVKGDTGNAGAQGVKGDTGNAGPAGAASTVPGPAGIQGDPGPQGIQGPAGTAGTAGAQGPVGPAYATDLVLGADVANSTVTAADVASLGFTPLPGTYLVEGFLVVDSAAATTGERIGLAWPTGAVGAAVVRAASAAAAETIAHGSTSPVAGANTAALTRQLVEVRAVLTWAAAPGAGNVRIQSASEVAGSAVTVKAGSVLRYRKIA